MTSKLHETYFIGNNTSCTIGYADRIPYKPVGGLGLANKVLKTRFVHWIKIKWDRILAKQSMNKSLNFELESKLPWLF